MAAVSSIWAESGRALLDVVASGQSEKGSKLYSKMVLYI